MKYPKKWPESPSSQQQSITQHLPARRKGIPEKRAKISSNSSEKIDHGKTNGEIRQNKEDEKKLDKLKAFDLTVKFGPCVGLSRMTRWERAKELGLDPPDEIRVLLEDEPLKRRIGSPQVERCLWNDILEIH